MSLNPASTSRVFRSALLRLPIRAYPPPFQPLPLPLPLQLLSRSSSTATATATTTPIATPNPPIAPAPASLPPTSVPISTPTSTPTPNLSNSTIPTPTSLPPTSLPWNEYLQLRRKRRHYNLFFSLATAGATTTTGAIVIGQQNLEQWNIFGLDPYLVAIMATVASGAAGWLLGPFIGNEVFGVVWRRSRGQIAAKDRDFYERIKRHRVDPSSQSYSNPVPDYYGEKIGSVKEFRNWMKDQRAYNKKRQNFL